MKSFFHALALCLFVQAACAQTPYPPILWNTQIASKAFSSDQIGLNIYDIAVSSLSGDVYVAAQCVSKCVFPNGDIFTLDSNSEILVLASYDNMGNVRWTKNLGFIGAQSFAGIKICTVASGGICVSGNFNIPSLDFGNGIWLNRNCAIDCDEIFMVRLNDQGEAIWARSIFGEESSFFIPSGLEEDSHGKLFLIGNYDRSFAHFGSGFVYDSLPTSTMPFGSNMFLGEFDAESGQTQKIHFTGAGSGWVAPPQIAVNDNGQMVMVATYDHHVVFENGLSMTTNAVISAFVAGFDADGNAQWVKDISTPHYNDILGIDIDAEGSAYLAIDASEALYVNDSIIKIIPGGYAGMVLKLNESITELPVFIHYNTNDYTVSDVKVDPQGNIYTCGFTSVDLNFEGTTVETDGCKDVLITITDSEGILQSARSIGGSGCETMRNKYYTAMMAFDQAGFLHAAGLFQNGFSEDGFTFDGSGAFIAKFNTGIVGTDEPVLTGGLQINPNPTQGNFIITLEEEPAPNTQLRMFDLNGRQVFQQEISSMITEIYITLPSSVYLVTMQDGEQLKRERIVISR